MRSTTCTEMAVARALTGSAAIALTGAAALADTAPLGCFERIYTDAHLAAHPDQGVAALHLWIGHLPQYSETDVYFDVRAQMAHQGQALRDGVGGRVLYEGGLCRGTGPTCAADGDGGWFVVTEATAELIVIETTGMRLVTEDYDDGGVDNTAEVSGLNERAGHPTRYRLTAVPDTHCEVP